MSEKELTYKFLTDVPIEDVHQCMQEAFADYLQSMQYMTLEVMKFRNILCRNNPNYSVGAFDKGKMVGFINVAIDKLDGELVAFDGGTGVIKEYRGQGVTGKMFTMATEKVKHKGINKFFLEVLQPNTSAIRAYEKQGFKVSRNFKCYNINVDSFKGKTKEIEGVEIKQIPVSELEAYWHYIKHPVSWEHMLSGVKALSDNVVVNAAFKDDECVGFIVYIPVMGWITAIGTSPTCDDDAPLVDLMIGNLFENIQLSKPKVSINNLEEEDKLNQILVQLGFDNPVDQYEMVSCLG